MFASSRESPSPFDILDSPPTRDLAYGSHELQVRFADGDWLDKLTAHQYTPEDGLISTPPLKRILIFAHDQGGCPCCMNLEPEATITNESGITKTEFAEQVLKIAKGHGIVYIEFMTAPGGWMREVFIVYGNRERDNV